MINGKIMSKPASKETLNHFDLMTASEAQRRNGHCCTCSAKYIERRSDFEGIKKNTIELMHMVSHCSQPFMYLLTADGQSYYFPLMNGFQVHYCNEFLRGLNTTLDIEFITYKQYSKLINKCFKIISK